MTGVMNERCFDETVFSVISFDVCTYKAFCLNVTGRRLHVYCHMYKLARLVLLR